MATPTYISVTEGTGKKLAASTYSENGQTVLDQKVIQGEPYIPAYTVTTSSVSTATANSHLIEIMAGAALNVRIQRIEVYQSVAATTATLALLQVLRLSAAGTGGGAVTPRPLDPADTAGATAMTLPSKGTEGVVIHNEAAVILQTVGASTPFPPLFVIDFERLRSKSLLIPVGIANGIALKLITAVAAGAVLINVWMTESSF